MSAVLGGLGGCAAKTTATVPAIRPEGVPAKYESRVSTDTADQFATLGEARALAGFAGREPTFAGARLRHVKVRQPDREMNLPKTVRAMDLNYGTFEIAEVPQDSAARALAGVEAVRTSSDAPLYVKTVTVAGKPALAWDPVRIPMKEDPSGTTVPGFSVEGHAVLWADGAMVIRIKSDTLSYLELLKIADSMY